MAAKLLDESDENRAGLPDLLADLDALERGFLLGLLAGGNPSPAAVSDHLAGDAPRRCREVIRAIEAQPRAERVRLMGRLAEEALAAVPAGMAGVHADVLAARLDGESPETLAALASAGVAELAATGRLPSRAEATDRIPRDRLGDLVRAVLAPIVPLPLPPPLPLPVPAPPALAGAPRRWALRLLEMSSAALADELRAAGANLLGSSLRGADPAALERAAAHVGEPWAAAILHAAAPVTDGGGAEGVARARAEARQLVASTPPGVDPLATLEELGARSLGRRLGREDPDLADAVMQRLPPRLGKALFAAAFAVDFAGEPTGAGT